MIALVIVSIIGGTVMLPSHLRTFNDAQTCIFEKDRIINNYTTEKRDQMVINCVTILRPGEFLQ